MLVAGIDEGLNVASVQEKPFGGAHDEAARRSTAYDFERLGVEVLIADMPNHNGEDRKDVLIRQIRGAIAEENRKEIIKRLLKGRQARVMRGLPPGGIFPYGP